MTKTKTKHAGNSKCDPKMVAEFDYSGLDKVFSKMSNPAKRALINNKILKPKDLAKYSLKEVLKLHGVGPSSAAVLKKYARKSD